MPSLRASNADELLKQKVFANQIKMNLDKKQYIVDLIISVSRPVFES
jgi:hypothetical protein